MTAVYYLVACVVGDMTPAECRLQWAEMNDKTKFKWTHKEDMVCCADYLMNLHGL